MTVLEKLVKMVTTSVDTITGDSSESFQNVMTKNELTMTDIVVVLLYLLIVFMFGKYLWNKVACSHVTVLKPLTSVWQLLGLSLLVQLFFC